MWLHKLSRHKYTVPVKNWLLSIICWFAAWLLWLNIETWFTAPRDNIGALEKGLLALQGQNCEYALKLWRPLAEHGDPAAQYYLGSLYDDAFQDNFDFDYVTYSCTFIDYVEAAKWYRQAADQGNALAQFSLGKTHYRARGMPEDFVQAKMWLNLASFHSPAVVDTRRHAIHLKFNDILASHMTGDQIAEAQRLTGVWLEAHKKK